MAAIGVLWPRNTPTEINEKGGTAMVPPANEMTLQQRRLVAYCELARKQPSRVARFSFRDGRLVTRRDPAGVGQYGRRARGGSVTVRYEVSTRPTPKEVCSAQFTEGGQWIKFTDNRAGKEAVFDFSPSRSARDLSELSTIQRQLLEMCRQARETKQDLFDMKERSVTVAQIALTWREPARSEVSAGFIEPARHLCTADFDKNGKVSYFRDCISGDTFGT